MNLSDFVAKTSTPPPVAKPKRLYTTSFGVSPASKVISE